MFIWQPSEILPGFARSRNFYIRIIDCQANVMRGQALLFSSVSSARM